ncbi:MAG: polysaccharide deacetylase family protein [Defluviitaleaceae bacterium]|nr:polysaccharide deacetylase family protein [Defluviitaleaceae bacterium]
MKYRLKHKLFTAFLISLFVFYLNPSTYGYYVSYGEVMAFEQPEYEYAHTAASSADISVQTDNRIIDNWDSLEFLSNPINSVYIHDEYEPKYDDLNFISLPVDSDKPMVALTFDDGPGKNTERILDILDNYPAHATFCVIGRSIAKYEDTVRRTFDAGHEIIGHSWDHTRYTILSRAGIERQIVETNNEIYRVTGIMPTFHRPPYGAMNHSVKSVSRELDMAILMWSVDPRDWETNATSDRIFEHIMDNVVDGSILLFHDIHDVTVYAIEKIVPALIERGYRLVTVSELMSHSENPVEAGNVYRHR